MIREIPQKVEVQPVVNLKVDGHGLSLLRRTRTTVFLGCLFAVGSGALFAPVQSALAASSLEGRQSPASLRTLRRADEIRRDSSRDAQSVIESARRIRDELRQTKIKNTQKSALAESGAVVHKVKSGDTLAAIAARYQVSVETLVKTNDLDTPNDIRAKDAIVVPTATGLSGQRFRVRRMTLADRPLLLASEDKSLVPEGAPKHQPLEAERTEAHRVLDLEKVRRQLKVRRQDKQKFDDEKLALTPSDLASSGLVIDPKAPKLSPSPKNAPGSDLIDIPVAARGPLPKLPVLELPSLDSNNYLPSEWQSGSMKFIWPAKGAFTSGYGWRWGRMHRGIDIAAPTGTPVVASAAGVVTYSRYNSGGYGNLVEVTHPDGSLTLYAHNHRNLVRQGQFVSQGQKIAEMGSTGRSTGPHTHFELHKPGRGAVNPVKLLGRS